MKLEGDAGLKRNQKSKLLIHSPYALTGGPNGVDNFIRTIVPELAGHYNIGISGPALKEEEENGADYKIGKAYKVSRGGTQARVSIPFAPYFTWLPYVSDSITNLYSTLRPHGVLLHEPLAGNSAHALRMKAPIRPDGKTCAAYIGIWHATSEKLDLKTRIALLAVKQLRLPEFNKYGFPKGWTPGVMNTVFGELDGMIAVSRATAKHWNEIYPGDYEVIYNPIDTKYFTPEGAKIKKWLIEKESLEKGDETKKDGPSPILFAAGRHDTKKGIDDLINAFPVILRRYPNARLKIAGIGKETENLKKLVGELGLKKFVEFVDVLTFKELQMAYRTADLFIAPSRADEAFGRIGQEARASGCPTIFSGIPGHKESMEEQTYGLFFEPGNPKDLANRAIEMLNVTLENKDRIGLVIHEEVHQKYAVPKIAKEHIVYLDEKIRLHGKTPKECWSVKKRKTGKEKKKKEEEPKEQLIYDLTKWR